MAITKQLTIKTIALGSISGLIGGFAMLLFFALTGLIIGIEADILSMARGMHFGVNDRTEAFILGIGMHLLTSVILGGIFGLLISKIMMLRVTNSKKGIIEGLIMAIVVFVVLYIPTTFFMVQPNLSEIISLHKEVNNPTEINKTVQATIPDLLGIGFMAHIVFGIVLGYTIALFRRLIIKNEESI